MEMILSITQQTTNERTNKANERTNIFFIVKIYLKTVATAKHFADYDLEGNYGVNRGSFNATVNPQDQVFLSSSFSACSFYSRYLGCVLLSSL